MNTKRCPECDGDLFARPIAELRCFGCRGCGGTWFEAGYFSRLAREHPALLARHDEQFRPGMQRPLAIQQTDSCPTCSSTLEPTPYPGVSDVTIRACHGCRGTFFPHGALMRVASALGAPSPQTEHPILPLPKGMEADVEPLRPLPSSSLTRSVSPRRSVSVPMATPVRSPKADPFALRPTASQEDPASFLSRATGSLLFFRATYGLLLRNKILLSPIGLSAGFTAMTGLAAYGLYRSLELSDGQVLAEHGGSAFLGAMLTVLVLSVSHYFFMAATSSLVEAHSKGLPVRLTDALSTALRKLPSLSLLAVLSPVVGMMFVIRARRERGGIVGFAIFMIDSAWTVGAYLLLPAIICGDLSFRAALRRSNLIHRGNFAQLAVAEIWINFVQGCASGLVLAVLALLVVGSIGSNSVVGMASMVPIIVATSLIAAVHTSAKIAYYTCYHLWADEVERRGGTGDVPVPEPFARSLSL